MTNQEKDLKNAREYWEDHYSLPEYIPTYGNASKDINTIELLAEYVQHLEQKGIIKFTANRNEPEGKFKPTECVRCRQELWLKDSDAGTDKELLRLCHVCIDKHEDKTP